MEATAQSRQQSQGVETHRVLNPALNPSVTIGNSNDKRSSYSSSGQFFSSFKNMDRLRRENQLCDVTIVVGTTRILAHKVVLASSSAYFEAMFTRGMMESREQEIELHGIDATSLEQLVNFMYTSNIEISEDNVQNLLPVSNVIQIESVRLACCEFLKNQLAPCNCLGILMFADTHGCLDLLETAKMYALRHFVEVSKTEEFLNLSIKRLIELVGENNLCAHDESQVYNAILSWIKHDLSHRSQHIGDLLSLIKLPLLSRDFLMFTVEPEELIRSNSECKDLVIEAMKYHLLPELRPYLQNTRTKPRQNIDEVPVVFSIGGGSLFAIHCECECYDPRNNRWCMVAPMSVRRARLGVGVVYGLVYAIGGFDGSHDLASVEIYNPKTNEWSMSTPMGTKRSSLGVAVLHNLLYAVGGYDGASCLSSVERYDPLLQQWSSVAPMTFRRRYVSVGVVGEYIIAAGGYDGSTHLNSVEMYDPVTNVWSAKCPMRSQRSSAASGVLNGYFYISGGSDGSLCLCTVERYSPTDDVWLSVAMMNNVRSSHAMVAMGDSIYTVGGNDGSSSLNSVERFDIKSNCWTMLPPMSTRRSNVGVAVAWILP